MKRTDIPLGYALVVMVVAGLLAVGAGYESPSWAKKEAINLRLMSVVIYNADANTTYIAQALTGVAVVTEPVWQCQKIVTYNAGAYPNQQHIMWANGSTAFNERVGSSDVKCESMLAADYQ